MQYKEFEKRYTNEWFSSGWTEVVPEKKEEVKAIVIRKDLTTLENEMEELKQKIESIELNQLRLANLAKMYD